MKRVFVDTSAWVAYFDKDEALHNEAVKNLEAIRMQRYGMVVSDYIFDEVVTTLIGRSGHRRAVSAGMLLIESAAVNLVWLDTDNKMKAWEFFRKHDDKGYSFTDCTSFVLMKEMRIPHYLSFDRHFEQAGFRLFT